MKIVWAYGSPFFESSIQFHADILKINNIITEFNQMHCTVCNLLAINY